MKACRTGSIIAFGALGAALVIGACREKTPGEIPPVTVARPSGNTPVLSGPADKPFTSEAQPAAVKPGSATNEATCPVTARFVQAPGKVGTKAAGDAGDACSMMMLAVVRGRMTVLNETLEKGDVIVLNDTKENDAKGDGLAVEAQMRLLDCLSKPGPDKTIIRGSGTPKLEFAGGKMAAWLDVGAKVLPNLYLGRLEGTAPVAEHVHASSWEIVASIEASGTFTLDGKEAHLGPRQIVAVPPNVKHAWKPDPGQRLVAIQMYTPPGPEQRFVTLAAEAKDAGRDAQ